MFLGISTGFYSTNDMLEQLVLEIRKLMKFVIGYVQMAFGTSFTLRRTKIMRLGSGKPEGRLLKYSQTLQSLAGELLLISMKAKLPMDIKLVGGYMNTVYCREDSVKTASRRYYMVFVITMAYTFFFSLLVQPAIHLPVWLDNVQEVSSLSRVFLDVERSVNQEVQQKLIGAEIARENHLRLTTSVVAGSNTGQSSTSKRQVCEPQLHGLHCW